MNAGSLFSGVGGLDLGIGIPPAWFCEYDKHCRTVLEKHWPGIPVYPDVRELGADTPRVDVLHGGYPCQPFSHAGLRQGEDDPRHLWPQFARLIRVLRPRFVVAENVSGHLGLGFDRVLADLACLGMDVRWGVVRASDAGAPHQRARLFVVAADPSSAGTGRNGGGALVAQEQVGRSKPGDPNPFGVHHGAVADTHKPGWEAELPQPHRGSPEPSHDVGDDGKGVAWGSYEPAIRRWENITGLPAPGPTDDRGRLMPEFSEWMMGLPAGWTEGAPHTQRLKMIGNAVVPQQARLALDLLGFGA